MQSKDLHTEHKFSSPSQCFIIGEARTNADNAITRLYGSFYMGFIIDRDSGIVTDFGCTHTLKVTEDFLRQLFVGAHFPSIDSHLESCLSSVYGGRLPGCPEALPQPSEGARGGSLIPFRPGNTRGIPQKIRRAWEIFRQNTALSQLTSVQ